MRLIRDFEALAAAPAMAQSTAVSPRASGDPEWWSLIDAASRTPTMARIIRLRTIEPSIMPLMVARDTGGQEPEPDEAATAAIVPRLASSFADRGETWAKYVHLILLYGRAGWLELVDTDGAGGVGWVVISPRDVQTSIGDRAVTVTIAGGHRVAVAPDRIIWCVRSSRDHAAEPWSDLATLLGLAELDAHITDALWARTDVSGQASTILSLRGSSQRVSVSDVSEVARGGLPERPTVGQSITAALRLRVSRSRHHRRSDTARVPMVLDADPASLAATTLDVPLDTGLITAAEMVQQRIGAAAGVPVEQLTGAQPKYANRFASRAEYLASDALQTARTVASAAAPLLAQIIGSDPGLAQYAGSVWWLDPTPLIDEARDDSAAMRGTLTASVARSAVPAATVSAAVMRAEASMTAAAEMIAAAVIAGDTAPSSTARQMVRRAVDAVAALGVNVDDATITAAVADAIAEAATITAAPGVATIARRIVTALKRRIFGAPTDGSPAEDPPIIMSSALAPAIGGRPMQWVYGLPSDRDSPYQPHTYLDGQTGYRRGDFAVSEPDGSPAWPGGHAGCQCTLILAEDP